MHELTEITFVFGSAEADKAFGISFGWLMLCALLVTYVVATWLERRRKRNRVRGNRLMLEGKPWAGWRA